MRRPEPQIVQRYLWAAAVILFISFTLRIYHLGQSSLRGDEAFAIRYWAQSPAVVLNTLADHEPHPLGTFFSFWAWKSLVGDSEFAIRMLPLLLNVAGAAGMIAFGRRLTGSHAVGLTAGFLWAINPDLIWHSQDARNYAMWAGISVISLWLLLRVSDRPRRLDWALYILAVTTGLYIFFLEAAIVVVHGLYVLIFRRKVFWQWAAAMLIVLVLLIPWFAQVWALAHSGYSGTAGRADLSALFTQFFPTLVLGEVADVSSPLLQIALLAGFAACLVTMHRWQGRSAMVSVLLLAIPALILVVAATRLDVFRPRYLVAVTPALLIVPAAIDSIQPRPLSSKGRGASLLRAAPLVGLAAICVIVLITYYGSYTKAPDWRGLREYLLAAATAEDAVIMVPGDASGATDPAFNYYYNGPADIIVLPYPGVDTRQAAAQALAKHRAVYLIPVGNLTGQVAEALRADGTLVETQQAGSFAVQKFQVLSKVQN